MEEDLNFRSEFNDRWTVPTRKILRLLSENARVSVSELAAALDMSRKTAREKMKRTEEEFGIKYTMELNEEALGLTNPRVILVKFTKKPDYDEVAKILAASHIPQIAARTSGKYDMIIYANAENTREYVFWDKTTQVQLAKYGVVWQSSDVAFLHLGFCPARNALIEKLGIPDKYKKMLLLLNENSRMTFHEMSKRLGMHFNTVAYNFGKLMKMGYVRRFTIVMRKPPQVAITSMFGKYIIGEGFEEDSMRMRKEVSWVDDDMPLISRFLFSVQLVGSFDFFMVGVHDSDKAANEHMVKRYKKTFKRHHVKVANASIQSVVLGDFPIRNVSTKKEFNMIKWVPNSMPVVTRPEVRQPA